MNIKNSNKKTTLESVVFFRNIFMAPRIGFEPMTYRLTAGCSTAELSGNISGNARNGGHIMKLEGKVKKNFHFFLFSLEYPHESPQHQHPKL